MDILEPFPEPPAILLLLFVCWRYGLESEGCLVPRTFKLFLLYVTRECLKSKHGRISLDWPQCATQRGRFAPRPCVNAIDFASHEKEIKQKSAMVCEYIYGKCEVGGKEHMHALRFFLSCRKNFQNWKQWKFFQLQELLSQIEAKVQLFRSY